MYLAFQVAQMVKNPPAMQENWAQCQGLGRSPGGGHGNPFQYSCLENTHGQRSLAGYSPWGCKESDMTEQLSTYMCVCVCVYTHTYINESIFCTPKTNTTL